MRAHKTVTTALLPTSVRRMQWVRGARYDGVLSMVTTTNAVVTNKARITNAIPATGG